MTMTFSSSKEKTQYINEKRELALRLFRENNWTPNREFLQGQPNWWAKEFNRETGEHIGYNEFYLISPCKQFAVTIKKQVIHVHAKSRKFAKVLNIEIIDAEFDEIGINQGLIQLKWKMENE